jgi:osmotically-inducible protein OsmY
VTQTAQRNDKEVQTNVIDELSYNPRIDATHLDVAVNNGEVTLSGEADSLPERHAAKRAAMRVRGVKSVADQMTVRDPGTSGTLDTDIAETAGQMLRSAVDVPSDAVTASVRDHAIALSGTVAWQYQREAAARAVMYIKGVTAVTNDISLTATAPPSGAKAAIEAAIIRNAQLNPRAITLDVADGDVTLRGTTRSWAERRQAEQVAWAAPGVTSVKNDLAVTS